MRESSRIVQPINNTAHNINIEYIKLMESLDSLSGFDICKTM